MIAIVLEFGYDCLSTAQLMEIGPLSDHEMGNLTPFKANQVTKTDCH